VAGWRGSSHTTTSAVPSTEELASATVKVVNPTAAASSVGLTRVVTSASPAPEPELVVKVMAEPAKVMPETVPPG